MSLWFRVQEYVVEVGLRLAKVVEYHLLLERGHLSAQLALESWIAGMLLFLIIETGIF